MTYANQNVITHINKVKDKNHMIISIAAVKAFNKIQHCFMIKIPNRLGVERTHLNILRTYTTNPELTSYSMEKN